MKNVFFIFTALTFLNLSCEKNPLKYESNQIKVFLNLDNSSKVIKLGETIRCNILLPDTLIVENKEKNTNSVELLQKINVENPQKQAHVSCSISYIDTINRSTTYLDDYRAGYSLISGVMVHLPSSAGGAIGLPVRKPYQIEFTIQPKQKGVYMIELSPQAYGLSYNDDKRAKLITRFNVEDKHHDLLAKYLSPENSQGYINSIAEYYENSGGVYGFRVE